MKSKIFAVLAGLVLFAGFVVAQPGRCSVLPVSAGETEVGSQDPQELERAERILQKELARVQAEITRAAAKLQSESALQKEKLAEKLATHQHKLRASLLKHQTELLAHKEALAARAQELASHAVEQEFLVDEGSSGWLGVMITEVDADKVKEFKLPAERGVLVTEVESGSPAAKAGLKVNDVITEFNGQRVESTAQFRRLVRETLTGRTVPIVIWREGRAQTLSITLGSSRDRMRSDIRIFGPRDFDFQIRIPEILTAPRAPRLGINAEDISGQLGEYFGAPGGEGILVREVTLGSAAEKAGMKAGDVIVKVAGERVRTLNDMREKLRDKRGQKTVSIGVIRKGAEVSLDVAIEQPKPPVRRTISRRITL